MTGSEPTATALFLLTLGALLGTSIVFSRVVGRAGVPIALLFLVVGMLAGSDGLGIAFEDFGFTYRIGTVALVLILFDGGLNTPVSAVRRVLAPAGLLATVGVVMTAALVAAAAHVAGFAWPAALLLGAIVSSTDAATVFSVLRGSGLQLKRRVAATLEVESGINDPMAVILTVLLTQNLFAPGSLEPWWAPVEVLLQMAVGLAAGAAVGFGGRLLMTRLRLPAGGLYPVLTVALACIAFGGATLARGSGFLAVYGAALVLGNGPLPYRTGLLRVHDALAWLSQITMFLLLGLLVFPSQLPAVAPIGLALALFLAFVARPLSTLACLLPFRYSRAELAYIGWVGLRGAVPIVLATYPVLLNAPGAIRIFYVVFFIVVVNALVPGTTVAWVTRRLGLESQRPPPPPAVLAIESRAPLRGEVMSFYVEEMLAVAGVPIGDLPLPDDAAVALLVRGEALVAPRADTVLQPGDHVYILAQAEDRAMIQLLFGRPEDE